MTWTPGARIEDWRDAEALAVWHFRERLGYLDALSTPAGSDGGVDVIASAALAQVKYEKRRVGRPVLQQLAGTRGGNRNIQLVFYSASGFTRPAIDYARANDVALFRFRRDGDVQGANDVAELLLETADARAERTLELAGRRPHWGAISAFLGLFALHIGLPVVSPGPIEFVDAAVCLLALPFACLGLVRMKRLVNESPATEGWGATVERLFFPERGSAGLSHVGPWESAARRILFAIHRPPGERPEVVFSLRLPLPGAPRAPGFSPQELERRRLNEMVQAALRQ